MWQNATVVRMEMPWLTLIVELLVSLGAAWFVCMSFFWRFGRRCTSLEFRVLDLEERSTKVAGRDLANKRWKNDRELANELASTTHQHVPNTRRFDNDPLPRE